MEYYIEKLNDQVSVRISKDVTIQNIPELKKVFIELLKDHMELSINNESISEIDLTYYQFLVALHNSVKKQNKKIKIITQKGVFTKLYNEIGIRSEFTIENIYRG